MYNFALMRRLLARGRVVLACTAVTLACDPSTRGRDASAPPSPRFSEVSVRIDVTPGGRPAISVLAFRASVSGLDAAQVLGVVDPLVAPQPEGICEVREVAAAARALRAQGGWIELEDLANVSLSFDDDAQALRPAPRVYPQLASAVGGVVAEAGPIDLSVLPRSITVALPPSDGLFPVKMEVIGVARLLDAAGEPLVTTSRLDPTGDLSLSVSGSPRTLARAFVEIRPFGASQALACPLGPGGKVSVPRELLDRVVPPNGHAPVKFEAVWRDTTLVPSPGGAAGQTARLSLETRSSTDLDLHAASAAEPPRPAVPSVP
jgi:hypothetical protein